MLKIDNFNNTVLSNISFQLKEGEDLVILGSNGAGKTTLAKVLCNIIKSDKVKLYDKNINSLSSKNRAKFINYIPSKLSIFDEYISLKEYLSLSKLYSSLEVDEAIKLLGVEDIANKYCKILSSGEQQLLLVASAILHNAKITIFDEPTSNLDQKRVVEVYKLLKTKELFQNKIVITHDLNLAFRLGYKILYIEDGAIKFFDEGKKFFEDKNLEYFFGSSIKKVDDFFVVNL
jgi:iron complex transport system ATP-binding protein